MIKQFNWANDAYGWRCEMPGNVTLCVSPDRTTGFLGKPARGTWWHAQASVWDGKSTISRYGRDEYAVQHKTRQDAMRAAERIYIDANREG